MDPAWLFRKRIIGGPFSFGNKVQPLRFHSLMEGNATKVVVEQWLNPLHSPCSSETFHRKIQTKDALQHKSYAQLANYGYIYILWKNYICIMHIYHYILCITCSIQASSLSSHPTWHLWTHCKVHFYKRHLFSSHCTLGCLKKVVWFCCLGMLENGPWMKMLDFPMEENEHFSHSYLSVT